MKWGVCVPVSVFALQWLSCCGVTGSSLLPVVLPNVVSYWSRCFSFFLFLFFLFMGSLDRVVHYYNKFHVWLQQLFDCILKIKPVKIKICFKLKKKDSSCTRGLMCDLFSAGFACCQVVELHLLAVMKLTKVLDFRIRQTFQKTL